jgi:hypothetical protein
MVYITKIAYYEVSCGVVVVVGWVLKSMMSDLEQKGKKGHCKFFASVIINAILLAILIMLSSLFTCDLQSA